MWTAKKCTHAGVCARTLPEVYKPREKPWISPQNASAEDLIHQIDRCPSGALGYIIHTNQPMEIKHSETESKGLFEVIENGIRVGEMTYSKAGTDRIIIDHTSVDPSQNGKGLGKKLVDAGVAYAREKGLKIIPLCPFASKVLKGSDKYADLL